MRTRVFVVSLLVVAGLTACTPAATGPAATPTPQPTTINIPAITIPADCENLVDTATYAATIGTTPLNDPTLAETYPVGHLTPTAAPDGAAVDEVVDAGTQLRCAWRDPGADVTYLQVQISSVGEGVGAEYLKKLQLDDYVCDDILGGTRCTLAGTDPQYQVEIGDTAFVRDDMVVRIDPANFPTANLLDAVVATLWHD